MTVDELIDELNQLPGDANVLFEVDVHVGPRDNGGESTFSLHVYSVDLDDDGDVILTTG